VVANTDADLTTRHAGDRATLAHSLATAQAAIAANDVVVVSIKQNPLPMKARWRTKRVRSGSG